MNAPKQMNLEAAMDLADHASPAPWSASLALKAMRAEIERLRKAQQKAEPVAEVVDTESDDGYMIPKHARLLNEVARKLPIGTKLYTAPPAEREQIEEGKRQWDEVARILGADGDNVDAVIRAAKKSAERVSVPAGLAKLSAAATPGAWTSMREGNQYVDTSYMPTMKCVAASRIDGPKRPWNPHALIHFGFKPEEYEKVRMTDADADFVCALVNWFRSLSAAPEASSHG